MNRVVVTRPLISTNIMQVCAKSEATDEEIIMVCNRDNLHGTHNSWETVVRKQDEKHRDYYLPVQCKDYSDRTHFIVMC